MSEHEPMIPRPPWLPDDWRPSRTLSFAVGLILIAILGWAVWEASAPPHPRAEMHRGLP